MSETETKASAINVATLASVLIPAVDDLQERQKEQGDILLQLQQRPIPDIEGLGRRIDERADALDRVTAALQAPKPRRTWWRSVLWFTAGLIVGGLLTFEVIAVMQQQSLARHKKQMPAATVPQAASPKKGK